MFESGSTTKLRLSRRELALRFLLRTRCELELMKGCVPDTKLPIEPLAMQQLERMAAEMSSAAEAFGFPEIGVIAGAIELLAQVRVGRSTVRERLELATRLMAQLSALEVHLESEIAECDAQNGDGPVRRDAAANDRRGG